MQLQVLPSSQHVGRSCCMQVCLVHAYLGPGDKDDQVSLAGGMKNLVKHDPYEVQFESVVHVHTKPNYQVGDGHEHGRVCCRA